MCKRAPRAARCHAWLARAPCAVMPPKDACQPLARAARVPFRLGAEEARAAFAAWGAESALAPRGLWRAAAKVRRAHSNTCTPTADAGHTLDRATRAPSAPSGAGGAPEGVCLARACIYLLLNSRPPATARVERDRLLVPAPGARVWPLSGPWRARVRYLVGRKCRC